MHPGGISNRNIDTPVGGRSRSSVFTRNIADTDFEQGQSPNSYVTTTHVPGITYMNRRDSPDPFEASPPIPCLRPLGQVPHIDSESDDEFTGSVTPFLATPSLEYPSMGELCRYGHIPASSATSLRNRGGTSCANRDSAKSTSSIIKAATEEAAEFGNSGDNIRTKDKPCSSSKREIEVPKKDSVRSGVGGTSVSSADYAVGR